jgi:hypothetical protein
LTLLDALVWLSQQEMPQMFFAGLCGGIVRWGVTMERWQSAVRHMGVGALTATFAGQLGLPIAQAAADWSGATEPAYGNMLSGFIVGVCAVAIITIIMDVATRLQTIKAAQGGEPEGGTPARRPRSKGASE